MRFKDHNYAEFYDMQQTEAGYPGKLLPPVIETLEGYGSVIDIGAGTGFFTLPLLDAGHRVTVVEPASEMSALILKKCPAEKRKMLTIMNNDWENWSGDMHDASVCVHSLYPMKNRIKAIELMYRYSSRRILIVREPSGMVTLSGQIRIKLGLRLNRDFTEEIKTVLSNIGADFTIKKIVEERPHRIENLKREAESITYQLQLDDSFKDKVEKIIEELCTPDSSGFFFNAIYSDNIFIF